MRKLSIIIISLFVSVLASAQDTAVNNSRIEKKVKQCGTLQVIIKKVSGTLVGSVLLQRGVDFIKGETVVNVNMQAFIFHNVIAGDKIVYKTEGTTVSVITAYLFVDPAIKVIKF